MALKTYIGARYAPQFMGEYNSTIEYKPLSVVYSGGISYTSRTYVPANTPLTNASFWIKSADYNAQVAQYRQEVQQYASQIDSYKQEVDKYVATVTRLDNQMQTFTTTITADFNQFKQDVNTANQQMQENFNQQVNEVKAFADETLHSFDTKAQMVADSSLKTGQTLLTCGGDSIGDGKASFYQVQDSATTDTVALANGKFARPFKLQAYEERYFTEFKSASAYPQGNSFEVTIDKPGTYNVYVPVNAALVGSSSITTYEINFNIDASAWDLSVAKALSVNLTFAKRIGAPDETIKNISTIAINLKTNKYDYTSQQGLFDSEYTTTFKATANNRPEKHIKGLSVYFDALVTEPNFTPSALLTASFNVHATNITLCDAGNPLANASNAGSMIYKLNSINT